MKDLREYPLKRDEVYHYFRTIMKDDCYKGGVVIMTFLEWKKRNNIVYMINSCKHSKMINLNFVI